ncbi:MAG: hypothetical protein ACK424_04570, partial [Candidatus Thermochlorobacter sp.]
MSHKVIYGNSINLSLRVTRKKNPELFSVLSKIEYFGAGATILRELLMRALESGELEKVVQEANRLIAHKVPMESHVMRDSSVREHASFSVSSANTHNVVSGETTQTLHEELDSSAEVT